MAKPEPKSVETSRDGITSEKVLDAAREILYKDGLEALSMRRIASELGVTTPTLYWHVGNREEILDRLIARITEELAGVEPSGTDPTERITSLCLAVLREVRRRPHAVALSATRGRGEAIFVGVQQRLARELAAAGLHGSDAAFALTTVLFHLGGFMLVEYAASDDFRVHGAAQWQTGEDTALTARLREGVDHTAVFEFTLRAILRELLSPEP